MNVTPLKDYAIPGFPTRWVIDDHPELLRLVPKRWQSNPAVLTALASLCMIVVASRDMAAQKSNPAASRVAPIFQHGDGRGSFGCISVSPPVFLSEDEARQVIVEQAKFAGITFTPDGGVLKDITVPATDGFGDPIKTVKTHKLDLKLDGTDQKRGIAYVYVSRDDLKLWKAADQASGSTVYHIDTIDAAKGLRKGLSEARRPGTVVVFYDPMAVGKQSRGNADWRKTETEREKFDKKINSANEIARQDLREQVQDFIKWAKAQGVI